MRETDCTSLPYRWGVLTALLVFLLLASGELSADTIHLKNGGKVTGEIVKETNDEVTIKRGSMEVTFQKKEIIEIERSSKNPTAGKLSDGPVNLIEAKALYEKGLFEEAAEIYTRAVLEGSTQKEVQEMAVICRSLAEAAGSVKEKLLKEARVALDKVMEIEPENAFAKKILAEVEKFDKVIDEKGSLPGDPMTRQTRHFIIRHNHPYIASDVAKTAEENLELIIEALGDDGCPIPKLTKKFNIIIYRDREEYLKNIPEQGKTFSTTCVGKDTIATYQEVAHVHLRREIANLVINSIFTIVPLWLREGLAAGSYEVGTSATYARALNYLEKNEFVPLEQLLGVKTLETAGQDIEAFRMQSRMTTEFLIRRHGGMKEFHNFCKRNKEPARGDEGRLAETTRSLLKEIYGYSELEKFDEDLKEYITHRRKEALYQERQARSNFEAKWQYKHKLESKHFVMFTTCEKKLAQDLLDFSERVYETVYNGFAGANMIMPSRIKIYLFDRKSELRKYLALLGHKVTPGMKLVPHFSPYSGAAVVFRESNTKHYLYQTTAHEITHAMTLSLFNAFGGSGCWVIEGIAHYVGMSTKAKLKKIKLGEIHITKKSQHILYLQIMLRDGMVQPLRSFIDRPNNLFHISTHVQCWALFHFLLHAEDGKYKDGFIKYLAGISAGKGGSLKNFEKHVAKVSEIEPLFTQYIRELKRDSKHR